MKRNKKLGYVIVLLIVVEIFMSLYIAFDSWTDAGVCGTKGCDVVKSSDYSQVFGIKLFYFALTGFILLLIFYYNNRKMFVMGTIVGLVVALYLVSLQLFVIGAICTNCMIVDVTMIVIFILTFIDRQNRKHLKGLVGGRKNGS